MWNGRDFMLKSQEIIIQGSVIYGRDGISCSPSNGKFNTG